MKRKIKKEVSEEAIHRYWRPLMAYLYAFICFFDFFLAPVLLTIHLFHAKEKYIQWQPLTLMGGGLFHLAMGAIVGITSYSRGQERMAFMNTNGMPMGPMGYGNGMGNSQMVMAERTQEYAATPTPNQAPDPEPKQAPPKAKTIKPYTPDQ